MTVASKIGKLLPKTLFDYLQPEFHFYRSKSKLKKRGGTITYNKIYGGWILNIPMPNKKHMIVLARSIKELESAVNFGTNKKNLVWKWLNWIDSKNTLYDVGSANGLEGFSAAHLRFSNVFFIEPYTPSIETILKTIFLTNMKNKSIGKFEVIHAACTEKDDYKRLSMHEEPIPGVIKNTYGDRSGYEERGGRNRKKVYLDQWTKGISIDSLKYNYKLKAPDYVKIDVDGHETLVIKGAMKTIAKGTVKSWAIEINDQSRINYITKIMKKHGYVVAGDYEHYPGFKPRSIDRIFMKKKYLDSWHNFLNVELLDKLN